MIALLSDLHMSDRSCGNFHLSPEAFLGVFRDLDAHAQGQDETHLSLVLLGDVLDLIHTEFWLNVPADRQPWGDDPSEPLLVEAVDAAIQANREIFELFRGELRRHFPHLKSVSVAYVPGNHDRVCNAHPRTRRLLTEALGLERADPDAPFAWHFLDRRHGLFARHGHQFDPWNCEERPTRDGSRPVAPVGDVITAMLLSKLPRLVRESLLLFHSRHPDQIARAEVDRITMAFRDLFDVRPFAALLAWLFHRVEALDDPAARRIVECAINQTARDFLEIPCAREWMHRHPFHGFELGSLLWLMARLPVLALRPCRGPLDQIVHYVRSDERYRRAALRDMQRYGVRYVAYGHTHHPLQLPLVVEGRGPTRRESFYLNTGTWRPTYEETLDRRGFVARHGLTYTIIYSPGGSGCHCHAAEAWTGAACERAGATVSVAPPGPAPR